MTRANLTGLCVLMATIVSGAVQANPWTRDQGGHYVNVSYSTISASSYYGPDGAKSPPGNAYSQHNVGLYAEVGILSRYLTGVLDANIYRRSSLETQGYVHGLGDLRLGLRSGLLVQPFRLTAGLTVGLPTGDPVPRPNKGSAAGADLSAASLPTGDGEPDVELSLAAGKSFGGVSWWPLRHYAIAELGYWIRTRTRAVPLAAPANQSFADAINWRAELGVNLPWKIVDRAWVMGRLFGSESFASSEEARFGFAGLGNGVTHRSYGIEIYIRIWRGLGVSYSRSGAWHAAGIAAGAQNRFALSWDAP